MRQAQAWALQMGDRQGRKEQQKWHRESVVETSLNVERVTNACGNPRAGHYDLPQACVGGREDGTEDPRLPKGKLRKYKFAKGCSQQDGEQHARTEQAGRQVTNAVQDLQVGATGIREKQEHQ